MADLIQNKIIQLCEIEGYTDPWDMIEDQIHDSMAWAICMEPSCDYTTAMEQDQRCGWCEEHGNDPGMQSIFVLMGVI